jgi:hypothetical protein
MVRIAMWSGPRNLSTALMRSFSSRPDAVVLDEPFYAHYLKETGIAHPGRDDVIAAYENDWRKVTDFITGPIPGGKAVWYQKHMAHHMLPHIDSQRLVEGGELTHAFLIRDPAEVIASYTKVHPKMSLAETGLPYQLDLFQRTRRASGRMPAVVDAKALLLDPRGVLSRLCERVGVAFSETMLGWPAGPHPQDGNWARYWYDVVYKSAGFEKYQPREVKLGGAFAPLHAEARRLYDELAQHRL